MEELNSKLIANDIIAELKDFGAYISSHSFNQNATYIKFKSKDMKTLVIRESRRYEKYLFKWNLMLDKDKEYSRKEDNVMRYFYGANQVEQLVSHIRNYGNKINDYKNKGKISFTF